MTDRIGQQLGLYRLIRFIGKGSFSEVYLGEHVRMLTQAVVKVLQLQLTGEEEERFGEETRVLTRLSHPHTMPLLDAAVHDSTPFVVMDYAPNGTLRALFPPGTPQAPGAILPYVWQVADALHFAHGQRLVHRNVKPENILLDARNEVLLSDFSIPVIYQSPRYQAALERAGSASYLAPEQIRGQATPASDQYALAAIVYEWLCGSPLFQGPLTEVMAKHLFSEPQPLRERVRTLSPAIEAVVLGALSKDPADRFPSVESFARAFEEASQAVPVLLFVPPVLLDSPEPEEQYVNASTGPIVAPAPTAPAAPLAPPDAPTMPSTSPAVSDDTQPIITPPPARSSAAFAPPEPPAEPQPIITPPPAAAPAEPAAAPPSAPILVSAPSAFRSDAPNAPTAMPAPAFTVPGRPRAAVSPPTTPAPTPNVSANPVSVTPAPMPAAPPASANQAPTRSPLDATWREVNWIPTSPTPANQAPLAPPPEPPRQGISRRTIIAGGLLGLLAGAGLLTWLGVNALDHAHSSTNPGARATVTPRPTSTPTPTPLPKPGDTVFTYHGHSGFVRSVVWSPDGTRIASASDDGTVQLWDAFTGTQTFTYTQHTAPVLAVAWSPDGTTVASGSQDKTLRIWDATSGQTLHTYTYGKQVTAIAWSPNGMYLAASSWDFTLGIWDAKTWNRLHRFGATGAINALSWSPDNIHVVSGDTTQQAVVWNVATGGRIRTYRGQTSAILALAWSPDGTGIASGADLPDTTLQYWNSVTLEQVWSITTQGATPALAWSPKGTQLAAGGSAVSLLNPANGLQILNYPQAAATLAWSPDGTHMASGGQPTTVQVWLTTA